MSNQTDHNAVRTDSMSTGKIISGRKSFVLLCVAFVLPVVLAKLALTQQWFNYGVTNQGQLLDKPVNLSELSLERIQVPEKWLLVYNLPADCQKFCRQTINLLSNTYTALGKEMPRVQSVALSNQQDVFSQEKPAIRWQLSAKSDAAHPVLEERVLFVVDPHGNVVLTHQAPNSVDDLPQFGKAIVADMKKLLKYSRIG
ncbi:hypothetical protein ACFSJY_13715 [Thalassotalea euphylliae]|uniref:hypothetical protein n=1 Tax=Thalassotalea euphylliae TaxID=1655234 RepID=UPI003635F288